MNHETDDIDDDLGTEIVNALLDLHREVKSLGVLLEEQNKLLNRIAQK